MKQKQEFKPQAGYCLSNHGGISIMINETGEAVRYQWYDNKPSHKWQQIKYNQKGEPYFVISGRRYYLSNFIRF